MNHGQAESFESEVVSQLMDLRQRAVELARRDGKMAEDVPIRYLRT